MKKYQVYIDVPLDEDWNDIEVKEMEVRAKTCGDALIKANIKAEEIYGDCYVWEVTEEDII